jgi:lysophospholipase L1-like esterase
MRVSLTVAAALLPMVTLATSASAEATGRYVALGDSFVAGPFIPNQHGTPRGCLRSDHNYPSLIAARLRTTAFVDVSCSGARTSAMASYQRVLLGWRNPPQLDALTPATTLVTLGIGGDDIGFTDIAVSCGTLGLLNPVGAPCAKRFSHDLDRRIAAAGPEVAAVLQSIHQRAPRARVLVVGYPRLLPQGAGCWPVIPLGPADTVYLDGVERALNWMLRTQAAVGGAEFVDTYTGGNGHDMCADSRQRWVEGVLPAAPAAPLHPNARGMRVVAARVLAALSRARLRTAPSRPPATPVPGTAAAVASPGQAPAGPAPGKAPISPSPGKVRVRPAPGETPAASAPGKAPVVPSPGKVRVPAPRRTPAAGKSPVPPSPGKARVLPGPDRTRAASAAGKVGVPAAHGR